MVLKNELEEDKSVWGNYEEQINDNSPKIIMSESFGPNVDLVPMKLDSDFFKNQPA